MADHALSCPVATTFSITLHLIPMSSLPSFVELMSSLGLEDGASHSRNVRSFLRPRSHSNASSSSSIDDEREQSSQQYTPSGAYLFVSADCDRREYTNFAEADAPRVSRKGRYSPYPTDSVRIYRSRWSVPSSIVLVVFQVPRKASLPSLLETEKAKRVNIATIAPIAFVILML